MSSRFFINLGVDADERYALSKFMNFSNGAYEPLNSEFLNKLNDVEKGGEFLVREDEARPDMISFKVYDTTQYWWIIMAYNDITDIDEISIGDVLSYPSLSGLEKLYYNLKARQSAQE